MRGREKNACILPCIAHSLSFLSAALQWIERNPKPVSSNTNNKTELSSSDYYIWEGTISDLIELSIAIYNIKLIRKASGNLISFAEIIDGLKLIFNIKIPKNIYSRKTRTMERKKNSSSMLERLLAVYKNEVDQLYK